MSDELDIDDIANATVDACKATDGPLNYDELREEIDNTSVPGAETMEAERLLAERVTQRYVEAGQARKILKEQFERRDHLLEVRMQGLEFVYFPRIRAWLEANIPRKADGTPKKKYIDLAYGRAGLRATAERVTIARPAELDQAHYPELFEVVWRPTQARLDAWLAAHPESTLPPGVERIPASEKMTIK